MDNLITALWFVGLIAFLAAIVASLVWLWTRSPYGQITRIVLTVLGVVFVVPLLWVGAWAVAKVWAWRRGRGVVDVALASASHGGRR